MTFSFTDEFEKRVAKLVRKNPQLRESLKKQFAMFANNPSHLGLKLHKLKGKRSEQYAIWIAGDLRAIAVKHRGSYIFFDLVTHDEY